MSNREDILAKWVAEEAAARAKLASPGITSSEQQKSMSGLAFLRQIWDGASPSTPIADTLNFVPIALEEGRVVFQGTPDRRHFNSIGSVHGGYFCTLLDSATACAVHSTLPAGMAYTTLEIKVNLIRALTDKTGPVRAEGKVIQVGRKVGIAEARIVDVDGKVYGHATSTCMIFTMP